jgi:pSer/pThr/pTyr-binding forkhead associated (FHA) protein
MTPFQSACGATGPLRWVVDCPGAPESQDLSFDLPFLIVGSNPGATLCLRHPDVSDRHAYIQLVGGRLFFHDLGSRHGTYLRGRRQRSGWIDRRSPVRVGPYRIRLVDGDINKPQPVENHGPDGTHVTPTVELFHRGARSTVRPLAEGLSLVGSADDCEVRLCDFGVSNYHAALIRSVAETWVVDLLGQGGLVVNGSPAHTAQVAEGDELRVGQSRVRFRTNAMDENVAQANPQDETEADSPLLASLDLGTILAGQPSDRVSLVKALLVPIADQFGRMQQHMLEQLSQVLGMYDRFTESQRDQYCLLKEELGQIRELAQDMTDAATRTSDPGRSRYANGVIVSMPKLGRATRDVSRGRTVSLEVP